MKPQLFSRKHSQGPNSLSPISYTVQQMGYGMGMVLHHAGLDKLNRHGAHPLIEPVERK